MDQGRITKELKDMEKLTKEYQAKNGALPPPVHAVLVGDQINRWRGEILGPEGTPYEGGTFVVDIELPEDYPFAPPKMRFNTKVWHPNVSSANGAICLDILKDNWSPALTIRTALLSLQALLSAPEPDDPQDAVVAKQYLNKRDEFNGQAKYWTECYAGKQGSVDEKLQRVMEMGFPEDQAREALAKFDGDENAAVNSLLGM